MFFDSIRAVAFDLDGTLIDTEKYYRVCWPKAFKHFGYDISDEDGMSLRSLGKPYIEERFNQLCKKVVDSKPIRLYARELVNEMIENNGLQLKDGVISCLEFLKKNNKLVALSTATNLDRANSLLQKVKIIDYFDKIVSAVQVEKGKPAPDIYLWTCEQLGVNPKECIAVEDSPNGAMSAINAGLNVVIIPDQTEFPVEIKQQAIVEFTNLFDFERYFKCKI